MLREIVERAIEPLQEKAEVLREVAEADAVSAVHALAWDETDEGERLRRYEMMFDAAWFRTFDLLFKIRSKGGELDLAPVHSRGWSVPYGNTGAIERSVPTVATVKGPPRRTAAPPAPPIEAKSDRENMPNEVNSGDQVPSNGHTVEHKDLRIDKPHRNGKASGTSITANRASHPVLDRVLRGKNSTLLDLSPIFGKP